MRLSATLHEVRGPGELRRVLVPARALSRTWVFSPMVSGYGALIGSRADLLRLGAWIRLTATSARTAVHLPVAANPRTDYLDGWFAGQRPLDLLVVRRDVGLRPSGWKAVRARLRQGRPTRVRTPEARAIPEAAYEIWRWLAERRITLAEHAGTLVILGDADALFHVADQLTEAGQHMAICQQIHRKGIAPLDSFTAIMRDGQPQGDLDFDVYGLDPIFHRSRWAKERDGRPGGS